MKTGAIPKVSVVMGVYNGGRFLREAVESILGQTFEDFEFLIINDASTDDSAEIMEHFSDPRIRIYENSRNEGLTRCLIKGCNEARGKYIARMDADDISYPMRFEKQVAFLEGHQEYAVIGTQCHFLDDIGKVRAISAYFCTDEELKQDVWRRAPFAHGATMFVREHIMEFGGYRELFRYAQDYDLWLRVMERCKVANLPDVLYGLRYHRKSITLQNFYLQAQFGDLAREFAQMRAKTGSDPITRGDIELAQAKIESWHTNGLLRSMGIRSERAMQLLDFMVAWGKLSDIFAIWLAALCNNPLNGKVWRFLLSDSLRLCLKGAVTGGLRPGERE